ncbi:MAG: 3-phosphoshikimate 1-carboxyvinyltransferase [Candidatus Marinimicrobia bacterium]|nr:3-phosphoshikimate 1-carboxyvinyltransferase [Candidatus Neomarinimicrobiota bacterium]|tara:strand:- start:71601 stop:72836 length:1236 start_codon:yes stop_codon:yes gene_type:complete
MLKGTIYLQGDKSISHRVLILASISKGTSKIYNLSKSDDVKRTINILRSCGITIKTINNTTFVNCKKNKLEATKKRFYCGNSGSTARFMLGFLPSQGISGTLYGDKSLSKRPMQRIIRPLKEMNIQINSKNNTLPITFTASKPKAYKHKLKIPSAQVKTALIFAALHNDSPSFITDPFKTRDHTERLLKYIGYNRKGYARFDLKNFKYSVAGDISSAAFLITAAILIPNSNITLKNILYNKTRSGYISILKKMGANIRISRKKIQCNEPICNMQIKYTKNLNSINLYQDDIITMIDEIPAFALLASFAKGTSKITDAIELRYKETDRIKAIAYNLKKFGINIREHNSGFTITGPNNLHNTNIKDFGDHRIAMMCEIAKLTINYKEIKSKKLQKKINVSFPEFYKILENLYV